MPKKIHPPDWHPQMVNLYEKNLTIEELLHEVKKRVNFSKLLNISPMEDLYSQEINPLYKKMFYKFIIKDEGKSILGEIESKIRKPVLDLSITDVLYLAEIIKNSTYSRENLEHKNLNIYEIIKAKCMGATLTQDQKNMLDKYSNEPWHAVCINNMQENIYPSIGNNKVPVTIDPTHYHKDILSEIKNLLIQWTGKKPKYPDRNKLRKNGSILTPISKKIIDKVKERKIFELFDLTTWFKICNVEHTKIELARFLWPNPPSSKKNKNETVSLNEYIEEVFDLLRGLFHEGTVKSLRITCEADRFLKIKQAKKMLN